MLILHLIIVLETKAVSVTVTQTFLTNADDVLCERTDRSADSVALWVDQSSDLCEVAVSLADVLDAGGLHQKSVICGQNTLDSLSVILHQRRVLPAAHERPHLLIGGDLWFLWKIYDGIIVEPTGSISKEYTYLECNVASAAYISNE